MVMVQKLRNLQVCATRADQLLDPGVAMDKRDNLGIGRFRDLLTVPIAGLYMNLKTAKRSLPDADPTCSRLCATLRFLARGSSGYLN